MKDILAEIVAYKRTVVATAKQQRPVQALENEPLFNRAGLSLVDFLKQPQKSGIIAEYKRRSPSKGVINDHSPVEEVTQAYANAGASGLSILTDDHFFGGSPEDLTQARALVEVPILRKDFIVDEYQVLEAKAIGADVILLIAECLTKEEVQRLSTTAHNLGLEVLLEMHTEAQLQKVSDYVNMVGINNRDLVTFRVDIDRSIALAAQLPAGKVKVAESGIDNIDTIITLRNAGFSGFLMGEHFMKQKDPGAAFLDFVNALAQKKAR
ncbi:indole-3-glycerol phosphate synthase [Chitinophaga costaii]|uniref:indole-3-glycerol-phosphate synthase n=1 Tax=Chitinophaga costaii TaxID=1335309 RepID=A0A1C3ZKF8_9BACT|nr:indole-3-glycerol phosphate synthase TrpC [Chitinophaga costaii]PUZ30411.1 indole-3-glycerol phosphate synthase TrpC [Chitinophaga costaii]SCB82825.1 indole-3-glycerol phosphate synthase [Chitinophaga costaii]